MPAKRPTGTTRAAASPAAKPRPKPGPRPAYIRAWSGGVAENRCFNTASRTLQKTREMIAAGRLQLPGSVILWKQTEGRRKGSAVWWATHGSLTVVYAFPRRDGMPPADLARRTLGAVRDFVDAHAVGRSVSTTSNNVLLDGKKVARVEALRDGDVDLIDVALNIRTDFSKAPAALRDGAACLLDRTTKSPTEWELYQQLTPMILATL